MVTQFLLPVELTNFDQWDPMGSLLGTILEKLYALRDTEGETRLFHYFWRLYNTLKIAITITQR